MKKSYLPILLFFACIYLGFTSCQKAEKEQEAPPAAVKVQPSQAVKEVAPPVEETKPLAEAEAPGQMEEAAPLAEEMEPTRP